MELYTTNHYVDPQIDRKVMKSKIIFKMYWKPCHYLFGGPLYLRFDLFVSLLPS